MQIFRYADNRPMPWKNGQGTTTEIVVAPAGAGLEDFDWRLSIARMEADAPFSAFPGIVRTLAIVEGAGLTLAVA
ncbi:HutD family protein, partial [Oceanibaculum nanhaiense]|uniref:HutD/Ves family protein n=1 Tax=Oceanibaculum nanhaiense TaxID=1909734 RepID=UPI00396DC87B